MIPLLAIDDDPWTLQFISAALAGDRFAVETCEDPVRGLERLRALRPRILISDLMMPGMSGLEVLERTLEFDPSIDVLLLTASYSTEAAVEAIQKGARDYLVKPMEAPRLRERVERLAAEIDRQRRAGEIELQLLDASRFQGIVGRSPLMLDVFNKAARIAPHFRTALVSGPTGTGKELVARALHDLSPAARAPFVVCNCAALTDTLVESELFGYVRGAFTGALHDKAGMFEAAHGGTLFLDEIGEMPLPAQAKLLRAVQQREIQRVGSPQPRKVDVRIVAATNRDLRAAVQGKQFREDLFFRLSMVELRLPSLAERRDDLPLLLRHFLERFAEQYGKPFAGFTRRAESALLRYSWPGNVREVENAIGYAAMMAEPPRIDVADLPEFLSMPASAEAGGAWPLVSLDEMQRLHARRVLEQVGGDKPRAAEILGVSRATLYRLLAADSGAAAG